jgi:hypothetical protein
MPGGAPPALRRDQSFRFAYQFNIDRNPHLIPHDEPTTLKNERFLEIYRHCGIVQEALRRAHLNHSAHDYWMRNDPTYPDRFEEADRACTRMLEDVAFRIARDGVPKVVLYEGKPVTMDGKKLYEVKYETRLLMKLLAARNREKYGEYKVVEVNWKDWDGDVSKLSPGAVRGLLDVLRKEAARQEKARAEASGKVIEGKTATPSG